MIRYINLCGYSYELDIDKEKHACLYAYTMEDRNGDSKVINIKIMEYEELLNQIGTKVYIPNLNVFFGGGDNYSLTVAKGIGIIVCSIIDDRTTYISEFGGKIRESSGYMLFAILKTHLNRYIFEDGLIPIHGALLGTKDINGMRAVAIIGESGTGKSTLCYRIQHDLNYDIYGDDLIVFDPGKNEVCGYCKEFFLKEDIIYKYGIENKCEKRNGKFALCLKNTTVLKTDNYLIVYLSKQRGFEKIGPNQLSDYLNHDIKNWCKSKSEEKAYESIDYFFNRAKNIFSGSYHATSEMLEAVKS